MAEVTEMPLGVVGCVGPRYVVDGVQIHPREKAILGWIWGWPTVMNGEFVA